MGEWRRFTEWLRRELAREPEPEPTRRPFCVCGHFQSDHRTDGDPKGQCQGCGCTGFRLNGMA